MDGTLVLSANVVREDGTPGRGGGPPIIGDFDSDFRPEIALTGSLSLKKDGYGIRVIDPDCSGAIPGVCRGGNIRWFSASQDLSSAVTGSGIFDFDGNEAAEAVYADECFV